jgi:uncharacterized protein (DUF885 family)
VTEQAEPARHPIHDLSRRYLDEWAGLDPDAATRRGVVGFEDRVTDHSPDGVAARADLARRTLSELDRLPPASGADLLAVDFHRERLSTVVELVDAGEDRLSALRTISSPVQTIRQGFDILPKVTATDWETIGRRLEGVPTAVDGFVTLLQHGIDSGLMSSRRQVEACAQQAETWAGLAGTTDYFADMVASGPDRLTGPARSAAAAYGRLAGFLRDEYLPAAPEADAVGPERYALLARANLGAAIDPRETYDWAWDDFGRIESDMAATADRILAGEGLDAVIEHLETDPARAIEGEEDLRHWLQDLMDRTIADLDGTHFDIAEPLHRVEAMIAPPGGAAAMYYTGPSQDFARPGRTWYPTLGRTRFPLWGEVSICYHEGVPGHHLQVAQVTYLADQLTPFQQVAFVAGHGEGWALYAERLMDELGYLDDPAYRLGYLRAQVMRALRVIVDIGMHLELRIPDGSDFAPGASWNPELGQQFVTARARFPADFMASEVVRYLGWAGQAISYKVGERVWLEGRAEAQRRRGSSFDLTAFHRDALDLGPLGLDQLAAALPDLGGA